MRTLTIIVLSVVLLLLIALVSGCDCIQWPQRMEGFENYEAQARAEMAEEEGKDDDDMALTEQEKEMFNDLRNEKLSDKEVEKMISDGKINEKMIEKFLANLDDMGDGKEIVEDFTVSPFDKQECHKYSPQL